MSATGAASLTIGGALRLLRATWRTEVAGRGHYDRVLSLREPFVFALWHGRMLVPILHHRREQIATMASQSKDGEIIARWLARNGYRVARGSSTRGGARAFLELLGELEGGRPAALTVDGPKGPPRIVQAGVVALVRKTGAWVLPISGSASRPRFLESWDRYLVPKAFSRNVVVYGEPFRLGAETDEEAARRIGGAIDAATAEADRRTGVRPPPPW